MNHLRQISLSVFFILMGGCATPTPQSTTVQADPRAEYQAALREYNDALEELDQARLVQGLYSIPAVDRKTAAIKFLGQLGTGVKVDNAERRVEVARQRLQAAQDRSTASTARSDININVGTESPQRYLSSDVDSVRIFFRRVPWFSVMRSGIAEGFTVTTNLISANTGKGVFADGTIIIKLFVCDGARSADRRLIKEWVLDRDAAYPFRTKQPTSLGYGFEARVAWGDIDVLGKQIAVQVGYKAPDGGVVLSSVHGLHVPSG